MLVFDSPYLKTKNAELLDEIINSEFLVLDFPKKEIEKIAKGSMRHNLRREENAEILIKIINWSTNIIDEYVKKMNGLCKGELKYMGAKFLNVHEWEFNQNILEVGVNRKKHKTDLKSLVSERGILFDKFYNVLDLVKNERLFLYPDITNDKHLVFHTDFDLCVEYAKSLTIKKKDKKEKKELGANYSSKNQTSEVSAEINKKESKENGFVNKTELNSSSVFYINEPPKQITQIFSGQKPEVEVDEKSMIYSEEEFMMKYRLENNRHSGSSYFYPSELERELILAGLKEQEALDVKSLIKRNYGLSKLLFFSNTENYSKTKIKTFASFYSDSVKKEELKMDLLNVLGIQVK